MNNWEAIVAFADQHDRPRPSRIRMDGVEIFSIEIDDDCNAHIVSNVVTTMSEARAVLGY